MVLKEYTFKNTKIKFYDDDIVQNMAIQKEYIDNMIVNLIRKTTSSNAQIALESHNSEKLNLVVTEKANNFFLINK